MGTNSNLRKMKYTLILVALLLLLSICLAEDAVQTIQPTQKPKRQKVYIFPFHYVALGVVLALTIVLGSITTGLLLPKDLKQNFLFHTLFYRKLIPTTNNKVLAFLQYNNIAEMSIGEWYITTAFLGLCATWFTWGYLHAAGTNHNTPVGRGFGWICILNASFILLPVTRYSVWYKVFGITYERAIKYHRLLSWWNLITVTIHGILIAISYGMEDRLFKLIQWGTALDDYSKLPGLIGGILFAVGGLVSIEPIRRRFWKTFVVSHVILNLTALAMVIIHAMWHQTVPFMATSIALYGIDLVLRFVVGYCIPAKITAVQYLEECDTVKLTIRKPGFRYEPGQYVFLWIDAIGLADSHPFTIASHVDKQDTVTMFVKNMSHKGKSIIGTRWTERLVDWAKKVQSGELRAQDALVRMEGPYGSISHNYDQYDTVVLVAGGVGITAMYSLFTSLIEQYRNDTGYVHRKVYLIWVKKTNHMWDMFPELLNCEDTGNKNDIFNKSHCEVQLYVTENADESRMAAVRGAAVNTGRPDLRKILRKIGEDRMCELAQRNGDYISVCGCGPLEMTRELEAACWYENKANAKFHFHRETFEL
jgi:predicted ferric reductase